MAYQLNQKIRDLVPYEPISGTYDIRLDANESYFALPEQAYEKALKAALSVPLNRYPDPAATELVRAFSAYYRVDPAYVTAGNGSDELISLIVSAFFEPEDELVTVVPDFSMYQFYAEVNGVKTTAFPKKEDLTLDTARLAAYLKSGGVRGVIFSNPCNPTSLCLSRRHVLQMIREVPDCLFVVDEAYMDFAEESILSAAHEYPNLIVLRTCSKAIGLAGLRLGFAVAGETITKALRAVKSPYNVNALSQSVGTAILSDPMYLIRCNEQIVSAREALYKGLLKLHAKYRAFDEVYEPATNFVFVKSKFAKEIYEKLLSRSIAVRFMGGYLRITAGTKEEHKALFSALEEIAKELSQ